MLRTIFTASFLFALWLLLSGIYKPLTLSLGAISAIGVALIVRRMESQSPTGQLHLTLRPLQFSLYVLWLLVEIFKANWQVIKLIIAPKLALNQHLFKIPYSQKTDLGQTIFANSITLTPGTISVEVEADHIIVHALDYTANHHNDLADMDRRASKVEFV